jgi:hypothetical protein
MSLTEVAVLFKKILRIFLAVVAVYYIFLLIIEPGVRGWVINIFVKPSPPNPMYGLLEPLEFVEKPTTGGLPQYVLNTKNGRLPGNIPDKMVVYKYKPIPYSYLAGKNALEDSVKLGFTEADLTTDLKSNLYKWRSIRTGGILEILTETRELKLTTNLTGRDTEFTTGTIDDKSAKEIARKLFESIGRFTDDYYPSGSSIAYLGRYTPSGLIETKYPRDAQIARVDFYRYIDKNPILGTDPKKGLLHAIVRSPSKETPKVPTTLDNPVVEAYFWGINPDSRATYPIISPDEAWKAVKAGKGVVSNVTPKDANPFIPYVSTRIESILIDNIYIAYYDTQSPQKFLQPIYVFDGKYTTRGTEGGYISIYFPAVTRDYTKQENPAPVSPPAE